MPGPGGQAQRRRQEGSCRRSSGPRVSRRELTQPASSPPAASERDSSRWWMFDSESWSGLSKAPTLSPLSRPSPSRACRSYRRWFRRSWQQRSFRPSYPRSFRRSSPPWSSRSPYPGCRPGSSQLQPQPRRRPPRRTTTRADAASGRSITQPRAPARRQTPCAATPPLPRPAPPELGRNETPLLTLQKHSGAPWAEGLARPRRPSSSG